jgi:uncharacterized protein
MNFNVSTLMQEPSGAVRSYEVDERVVLGERPDAPRVSGSVRLMRTDRGVWVSAGLDSEAPCRCVRCLEPYGQPIRMEIEEEYLQYSEPGAGASADDPDAEAPRIDEGQLLDMTRVISQYVDLSLPMKPVCRSECKGLCIVCGSDLNVSACRCDRDLFDSRWAPLADVGSLVGKS